MGGERYAEASKTRLSRTLHHVMVRGIEKRRIVDDETDRRKFVRRLGALLEETRAPIYACALMNENFVQLVNSVPKPGFPYVARKIAINAFSQSQKKDDPTQVPQVFNALAYSL